MPTIPIEPWIVAPVAACCHPSSYGSTERFARSSVAAMNNVVTRAPVESSCIASLGYAEATRTLGVEFKSGAVHHYSGVPWEIYESLMAATSKGAYLNRFIKGRYPEARQQPRRSPDIPLAPRSEGTAPTVGASRRRTAPSGPRRIFAGAGR